MVNKMFLSQVVRSARSVIRTSDITVPTKWGHISIPDGSSLAVTGGPNGGGPSKGDIASLVMFMAGILTLASQNNRSDNGPDAPSFKRS